MKTKIISEIDKINESCDTLFVETALHTSIISNAIEDLEKINERIHNERLAAITKKKDIENVISQLEVLVKANEEKIAKLREILNV